MTQCTCVTAKKEPDSSFGLLMFEFLVEKDPVDSLCMYINEDVDKRYLNFGVLGSDLKDCYPIKDKIWSDAGSTSFA